MEQWTLFFFFLTCLCKGYTTCL